MKPIYKDHSIVAQEKLYPVGSIQEAVLHELKGDKKGIWSITVNGNWRITFEFENGDAHIVNYEDYH